MERRMILFYMLFFCSSVALTAPPHKIAKYRQLHKTIRRLETTVKDKDAEWLHTPENPVEECLFTAVACFQNGILKLQPKNSQVNSTFTPAVQLLSKRFTVSDSGQHCKSSCESYEKKSPKDFLKSLEKLIQKLLKD